VYSSVVQDKETVLTSSPHYGPLSVFKYNAKLQEELFMSWTDSNPLAITNVKGSTGWGSDGDWYYETQSGP
jgi:hypothetical protein